MKKILIACLLLALLLSGCGKTSDKPIDFQGFSSDILSSGAFSEELMQIDNELGCAQYMVNEAYIKEAMFFFSSGATSEELALFEANDAEALKRIKEAVEKRVEAQSRGFENYVPSEVPKLEKAVVFTRGNYIILIVANDYAIADDIIKKY